MTQAISKHDPLAAIRIAEFKHLMIGRFLFIMGLRMMGTIVGWWVYELTNDPFAIGLVGLSEFFPAVGMALYAGYIIDISEKRKLILTGVVLYALVALLLICLSGFKNQHQWQPNNMALVVYLLIFCTGIIRSFTGPCFSVILAAIVPKQILPNATTWSQGTWLSASVTGHALGGILIAFIGITGALSMVLAAIVIAFFFIRKIQPKAVKPSQLQSQNVWQSVKEGVLFVFRTKAILSTLSLDLFAVLFGGAVAMVPVFARDILKVGAHGFGWLNAAADIGAIAVIVLLTIYPLKQNQGKKMFFAVAGFGVCIIVFALSKVFWLSFFALMMSGFLDGISVVIRGTILQLNTPDEMRGRVMSVNAMFINSSNELGQFESGLAARYFGVVPSVFLGGLATITVVIITWLKSPSLRKLSY
ncbi:MAG: MFS transporter [Chitinophagaceae bacterium]